MQARIRSHSFLRGMVPVLCGLALVLSPTAVRAGGESGRPTPTPTPVPTHDAHSLASLASKVKLRTTPGPTGSSGVVITNENLKSYAEKGKLTTASGQPKTAGVSRRAPGEPRKVSATAKKSYWRGVYSRQKQLVASMEQRLKELNGEIAGLQNKFYAWDDPAYRDGVIKPALDKKLNEAANLRKRLPEERKKLDKILEDARHDGAQPGWFRDLK